MANHRGIEGIVKIGSDVVAEMREWSIDEEATTIDDTELSDEWDTHALGRKKWSGSLTCFWDETDTAQIALTIGASVTLDVFPEGTANPDTHYSGAATVTKITRQANRGSMVDASFEFVGNGELTEATVV